MGFWGCGVPPSAAGCGHPALRQDQGRFASPVGGGVYDAPFPRAVSQGERFRAVDKRQPLRVLRRAAWNVVGRGAHTPPSTYDSTPIDAAACGQAALRQGKGRFGFLCQSLRPFGAPPFTQGRLWCGGSARGAFNSSPLRPCGAPPPKGEARGAGHLKKFF